MYHRKIIDEIKIKRLWWLEPEKRAKMRKHRKQCSCWMCGNPRQGNSRNNIPISELGLKYLQEDEIDEYIKDTQE